MLSLRRLQRTFEIDGSVTLRKVTGSKEAKKLMYEGARKLLGWDGSGT